MVALADWYILPILLQLEKLSGLMTGPSCYWLDLVAVDEYAELEVQPIRLDLSIKYTGQILFDSIVMSFKTPGQWKNSTQLDKNCILEFYIKVYSNAAKCTGRV